VDTALDAITPLQSVYSLVGFAVGALIGLTGVGGGSLMTPVLILLFGLHPATAVGTDLLFAATTKTAGTWIHGLKGTIDWCIVRRLATGSVPLAVITMSLLSYIDITGPFATQIITTVLTIALSITAILVVFRTRIIARYAKRIGHLTADRTAVFTVAVGALLGLLVSISSVGAGAIGMTALVLLYPQLPTSRLVGSDIAHAVPLTLAAGLVHWQLGSTDMAIFLALVIGSVPGILISSYAAARVPEGALRVVLAAALLLVAIKLAAGLSLATLTGFALATAGH
jgi:uncharacterized protein